MAVKENSNPTVVITNLSFTYPGIDGHPPPGSTPLIDEFSLTLNSGDRCLLVGSNGAGSFPNPPFSLNQNLSANVIAYQTGEKNMNVMELIWFGMNVNLNVIFRENDDSEDFGREAHGGAKHGSCAG